MNNNVIVAKIEKVVPIVGADRIHTAYVLGEQIVVSKEMSVGDIGLYFIADTQLSEDFCKYNNLYRNSEKNQNQSKTGFFDDNRRVRCQPFLKVRSEGYFCPIESLSYLLNTKALDNLKVGDSFGEHGGITICEKYISEKTKNAIERNNTAAKAKGKPTVTTPEFHKHVNTGHYIQNTHRIEAGDYISFHAKVHGTSARMGLTKVVRKPNTLMQKIKNLFGFFERERMEYIVGTRNVVLSNDDDVPKGSNQYRFDVMDIVKPYLENGMTIYGEIAGYAGDKPIMGKVSLNGLKDKKYTKKYGKDMVYNYGCGVGEFRFHIYRITQQVGSGVYEYGQNELEEWCESNGLMGPTEAHPRVVFDGDITSLNDLVTNLTERPDKLTQDYIDPTHVSEGVIIRVDKPSTSEVMFLKSKSYAFKVLEGILKERGEIDEEEIS